MAKDNPLAAYGRHLHQDAGQDAHNPAELAANALASMQPEERRSLRAYLAIALEQLSASELKGELNRANENWRFTSKGAEQFLRSTLEQLEHGN